MHLILLIVIKWYIVPCFSLVISTLYNLLSQWNDGGGDGVEERSVEEMVGTERRG